MGTVEMTLLKKGGRFLLSPRRNQAGIEFLREENGVRLKATGLWTIREAGLIERQLNRLRLPKTKGTVAVFDLASIERMDTAGAWLLHQTTQRWRAAGMAIEIAGASEKIQILLDEIAARAEETGAQPRQRTAFAQLLCDMAGVIESIGRDVVMLTAFLGALTATFFRVIFQPWRFRIVPFVHHLEYVGLRAVPIIFLICLLIGAVILQQGAVQLRNFGAEALSVNMVGILSLREVGVLLTAIMVAGRSGSAFTAEIGAMKMREEIDAMRTLGIDPMETLVLPRVLALIVILPLLTLIGDLACLTGGAIMAKFYLGLDLPTYATRLQEAVAIRHFWAGMLKAPFIALAIAIVGCLEGLKVAGSAESLGHHVTSAVVKSIFLVMVLDAVFALFFSAIGL